MIYFVTQTYLVDETPITANVDVTDITPWLKTASEMGIQPILGRYFYNDLLTKYNAQTLTADEILVVELIQPAIAWRAASEAVYGLTYQLKNKGLQTQNGDNSESVELSDVQFGMSHYLQKAGFYEDLLIKYLKENKDLYPNFITTLNTDSLIKPQKTSNLVGTIRII